MKSVPLASSVFAPSGLSRRAVLGLLAAGAAWAAARPLFATVAPASVSAASVSGTPLPDFMSGANFTQPFTLPDLPYAVDALEPHFDARTMELHHGRHHRGYVNAANMALAARPDLRELTAGVLLTRVDAFEEPLRSALRDQLGGHVNHAFFWRLLAPPGEYRPGPLRAAIERRFGSLGDFQAEFARAALGRFGSGWAWLVVKDGELEVLSTPNQDSPLVFGAEPVIGLDVWEHAYYLKYQNRRADFVSAFWKVLNWDAAERAYAEAMG